MPRKDGCSPGDGRGRIPLRAVPAAGAAAAAVVWLAAACGGDAPGERDPSGGAGDGTGATGRPSASAGDGPVSGISELEPPTGPGSGQPRLAADPEGGVVLSWLRPAGGEDVHELAFARFADGRWSGPRTVARGDDFFVNWADLPSVAPIGDDSLVAHWLQKTGPGPYAYGVRMSFSGDAGETWGPAVAPHRDGTLTEHGFVSLLPAEGGGVRAVWLDGRRLAEGEQDAAGGEAARATAARGGDAGGGTDGPAGEAAMTLRSAVVLPDGRLRSRSLVDGRVCDCCQTSAARTPEGPVVVYRDRSSEEVRDVSSVRLRADGWTPPATVHEDGWRIDACPVNGPAVAARGDTAAVAWFTGADGEGRVRVAFSTDAGASFGPPVDVDGGDPVGRVDLVLPDGDRAVVSWVESTADGAEIRLREVGRDGTARGGVALAPASAARAGGFPRTALSGDRVLVAWTDPDGEGRVRVARASLGAP